MVDLVETVEGCAHTDRSRKILTKGWQQYLSSTAINLSVHVSQQQEAMKSEDTLLSATYI